MDSSQFHLRHLQDAARDGSGACVQGPSKSMPLDCMLLETLSFFCFWKSQPLTFPSVPSVFCMGVMGLWCSLSSVPIRSLSSEGGNSHCFLKGPPAFPIERTETACWLSALILFAFILLFLGQTFVFLTYSSRVCLEDPPGYLIPSQGMKSFPKHTILKQISTLAFLNRSIPLRRRDLIRSIANSGLTSFIYLAWLPSSSFYLPCAFPWEDPNSINLPGRFPGGTGNSYFPIYDNHPTFQFMTPCREHFILASRVSSFTPVRILHGCLGPRGVHTQLFLLGNIYPQFHRAAFPPPFPNFRKPWGTYSHLLPEITYLLWS